MQHQRSSASDSDAIIYNVYFAGTGHSINWDAKPETWNFLPAYFFTQDTGTLISGNEKQLESIRPGAKLKRGFDGVGVTHGGFMGGIYGTGTEANAKIIAEDIVKLRVAHPGQKIILNCMGHSRGAISALLTAKELAAIPKDELEMNLLLHDPVPGNLEITHKIMGKKTLAGLASDLSDSKNINEVVGLYTDYPLLSLAAHAPLVPTLPSSAKVTLDVIPGMHALAQFISVYPDRGDIAFNGDGSFISYVYFEEFMKKHGAQYASPVQTNKLSYVIIDAENIYPAEQVVEPSVEGMIKFYDNYLAAKLKQQKLKPTERSTHSTHQLVIHSNISENTPFLNKHHARLKHQNNLDEIEKQGKIALTMGVKAKKIKSQFTGPSGLSHNKLKPTEGSRATYFIRIRTDEPTPIVLVTEKDLLNTFVSGENIYQINFPRHNKEEFEKKLNAQIIDLIFQSPNEKINLEEKIDKILLNVKADMNIKSTISYGKFNPQVYHQGRDHLALLGSQRIKLAEPDEINILFKAFIDFLNFDTYWATQEKSAQTKKTLGKFTFGIFEPAIDLSKIPPETILLREYAKKLENCTEENLPVYRQELINLANELKKQGFTKSIDNFGSQLAAIDLKNLTSEKMKATLFDLFEFIETRKALTVEAKEKDLVGKYFKDKEYYHQYAEEYATYKAKPKPERGRKGSS